MILKHQDAKTPRGRSSRGNEALEFPGWQSVKLKEVCELNPRRPAISRADDTLTTFVPMPAVAESGAGITKPQLRPFREVRTGYTYFGEGDVLFAKITPCMENGKHAIARDLTDGIGFGSTEFHVLHAGPRVISEWIHFFVLQPWVVENATAHFTGAVGQQRVPQEYLAALDLPLPPLAEQRRIAARLRGQLAEVAQARAAIEAQLAAAQALPAAHLRAVFESDAAKRWPKRRVDQIISRPLRTGLSKLTSASADKRCLTLSAVRNGILDFSASKPVAATDHEARANGVQPGVFYVVRGNGNISLVARGALAPTPLPSPVLFPDLLIEVHANPAVVLPHYLRWVWDSPEVRRALEARSMTSTGIYKINLANLSTVVIPVPPIPQQEAIIEQCQAAFDEQTTSRQRIAERLAALDQLPAALLREAFAGTPG